MRKIIQTLFRTAALIFMFCLTGTAFAEQCVDNGDGTVTDNDTGLMWQKATADPMDWDSAMSYASGLSLGGYSDWRLPDKDELDGLYHSPCKNLMHVHTDFYWSSTTDAYDTNDAWLVYFSHCCVGYGSKSLSNYVRAVRAGQ